MRMVFALLFFVNNEVVEEQTQYFYKKQHCLYMCQELARPSRRYEAVDCVCKVMWVDASKTGIK